MTIHVECPICHGRAPAIISGSRLTVGRHTGDNGGDCDGWGKELEIPNGLGVSNSTSSDRDRDGLSGLNEL